MANDSTFVFSKTVKLEDREIDPERYMDKAIRLDVVATTELGHVYQIEVQVADQVFIDQRSLYYWASLYHRQLQQGKLYNELKPTIRPGKSSMTT